MMIIKRKILFILIVIFIICCNNEEIDILEIEQSRWNLNKDSVNIAILLYDFDDYNFIGGYYSVYAPCEDCFIDSIPFVCDYQPSIDDGWGYINIQYTETLDTLFYSEDWGWGLGQIIIPDNFLLPDSFQVMDSTAFEPISIEYLSFLKDVEGDPSIKTRVDSVMGLVMNLDITQDYSQYEYRIGLLFYLDEWVVFLFKGNQ